MFLNLRYLSSIENSTTLCTIGNGNESPYTLTVEGNIYGGQHGSLFLHQRPLSITEPDVRIILDSEHPAYRQGQEMQFRAGMSKRLLHTNIAFIVGTSKFVRI